MFKDLPFKTIESSTKVIKAQRKAIFETKQILTACKDKYNYKRCIIIGDNPDSAKVNWALFKHEYTFSLNKSFRFFDLEHFHPTFYIAMDPVLIKQCLHDIYNLQSQKFLGASCIKSIDRPEGIAFLNAIRAPMFQKDITEVIYEGQTVEYIAIQIAYHMGFNQVALISVSDSGDARAEFQLARNTFESDARILVDATIDGRLNVLPRIDYNEFSSIEDTNVRQFNNKSNTEIAHYSGIAHPETGVLVSAIVSTYNAESYIHGCLDALEKQTIADRLEIIVINSGSRQNEDKIVRQFMEKYDNIRYIKTEERETVYQAWNRAIKIARGKYLTNANTDDRHYNTALEKMALCLENNPEQILVYANQQYFKDDKGKRVFLCNRDRGPFSRERLLAECFVGPQPMWRAAVHDEFGYFDETFFSASDYEFWLRISQKYSFFHLNEILGEYLMRSDSVEKEGGALLSTYETSVIQKCYQYAASCSLKIDSKGLGSNSVFSEWFEMNLLKKNARVKVGTISDRDDNDIAEVYDWRNRTSTPKLTIIIVTYNRKQALFENLVSLKSQNEKSFEVVVINNGNPLPEFHQSNCGLNYDLYYIRLRNNYGASFARNLGATNARGHYIAFLDDDAFADTYWTRNIIQHFENHTISALRGKVCPKKKGSYSPLTYDLGNAALISTTGTESNSAYIKETFLELGGFDKYLFCLEGAELSYRICKSHRGRVDAILYFPDVVIFHNYSQNAKHLLKYQLGTKMMLNYLQKKWPDFQEYLSHMWIAIPKIRKTIGYSSLIQSALFFLNRKSDYGLDIAWEAVKARPFEPFAYSVLGNAFFLFGDFRKAELFFEMTIEMLEHIDSTQSEYILFCNELKAKTLIALQACREQTSRHQTSPQLLDSKTADKTSPLHSNVNRSDEISREHRNRYLSESVQKLSRFENKHIGKRCVIIGNGPSLNKMDLSFLNNEFTFGMNRIYLLFDKWGFTPTYYVSVNPLVIEQSINKIERIPSTKFLSLNALRYVLNPDEFIFLKSIAQPSFSKHPLNGLWEGHTVTYVALQLAYFMGFKEVILIGVDHHFVAPGQPNQEVVSEGEDPNHFHPEYFGKGIRWNLPDLEKSEIAYRMAKDAFESDRRKIIDATVDGKLTIFPKVGYEELFLIKPDIYKCVIADIEKVQDSICAVNSETTPQGLSENKEPPGRQSAQFCEEIAFSKASDVKVQDSIELLSTEFLDENREIVDFVYSEKKRFGSGLGWHYILDISWILKNMSDLPQGSVVLDAGAGNGLLQFLLAELGFKVISVDFSPRIPPPNCANFWKIIFMDNGIDYDNEYIKHLKKNYPAGHLPMQQQVAALTPEDLEKALHSTDNALIYYRSDFTDMRLIRDNLVDCVVSVSALEHNEHTVASRAVQELTRVLKPEHKMLLTVSASLTDDWYHEPSKGWCYSEKTLKNLFNLPHDTPSNFSQKEAIFEKLKKPDNELHRNLEKFYFQSGENGMPWGIWNPQYLPVGILRVK